MENKRNRKELRAARNRNYAKASWYAADHYRRYIYQVIAAMKRQGGFAVNFQSK